MIILHQMQSLIKKYYFRQILKDELEPILWSVIKVENFKVENIFEWFFGVGNKAESLVGY